MHLSFFILNSLRIVSITILFAHSCFALSTAEVQELYKEFEDEFALICYEPAFEKSAQPVMKEVLARNIPENINLKKIGFAEPLPACDKAVIASMVKDEEDIIFENLCCHYYMGFRKFIIVDNGSTDATSQLINKFKELTAASTSVVVIDDPEVSYRQASRMNAVCKVAEIIFPEVVWIFPNDADEFITLDQSLEAILSKIPCDVNCIHSPRIFYIPKSDFFGYRQEAPFYQSIYRAHKRNPYGASDDSIYNGKTFIKAHQGLVLTRGNHFVAYNDNVPQKKYQSSLEWGIHIREFPLRSPQHALKKIINIGKAITKFEEIHPNYATKHYANSRYDRYLKIGDAVGMEEFKAFITKGGCSFDEQMPVGLALKLVNPFFCEQPHEHWKDPHFQLKKKNTLHSFYERGLSKGKIKA